MRFIKALVVLAICIVGLGFFRGWFTLSSQDQGSESNKVGVNLTVDPDKVKEDGKKVKDKTSELGHQATDKVKSIGK